MGWLGQWQRVNQGAAGFQYGQLGWTHTISLIGSVTDSVPYFQNALAAYQLSLAKMLGNPIDASGASSTWSYLVASVFAQVGLGAGNYGPAGSNVIKVGLLAQAQAEGQIALTIGSMQVIFQGALVYSYLQELSSLPGAAGLGHSIGAAAFGGIQHGFPVPFLN